MILDDIIAPLIGLINAAICAAIAAVVCVCEFIGIAFCFLADLLLCGFHLGTARQRCHERLERRRRQRMEQEAQRDSSRSCDRSSRATGLITLGLTLAVILGIVLFPKIYYRQIALVTENGRGVPFAGVMVQTPGEKKYIRTRIDGAFEVPRFGLEALTVTDSRYVEQTWSKEEIQPKLVVRRTVLGAGFDKLADKLLRPEKR